MMTGAVTVEAKYAGLTLSSVTTSWRPLMSMVQVLSVRESTSNGPSYGGVSSLINMCREFECLGETGRRELKNVFMS